MTHNPFWGVISIGEDVRDYIGAEITFPVAPRSYDGIQYNQKDVSSVSCTVHGACGAYSDLTGYEFTLEERKDLWDKALSLGADPSIGWYVLDAVKLIAKERGDVTYYRVSLNGSDFKEAIDKGYSVVSAYRGNSEYSADFRLDGILDLTKYTNPTTYGHCIRISKGSNPDTYNIVIDNYEGRPYNVYDIPVEHFNSLVLNNIFFQTGYVFCMTKQIECPDWATSSQEFAIKNGISDGTRPNDNITRAEAWVMLERLYNLKQQ